jgi:DnaJ-class molecular chaperone
MKCPQCDGFGYLDEDGEMGCALCDGNGTVPDEAVVPLNEEES